MSWKQAEGKVMVHSSFREGALIMALLFPFWPFSWLEEEEVESNFEKSLVHITSLLVIVFLFCPPIIRAVALGLSCMGMRWARSNRYPEGTV